MGLSNCANWLFLDFPATTVAKKIADDAIDALGANPTEEEIQTAIDNAYNKAAEAFGLSEAFTGAEASESCHL